MNDNILSSKRAKHKSKYLDDLHKIILAGVGIVRYSKFRSTAPHGVRNKNTKVHGRTDVG